MKRRTVHFWVYLAVVTVTMPLYSAQKSPIFDVSCPTILAFFPPVTDSELSKDPDTNEALGDFQLYARQVRGPLEKRGIEFHEVFAHSFTIRVKNAATTFKPTKVEVGYYLVAPGRKPRIEYRVMTDADLLQVADEYFGTTKK